MFAQKLRPLFFAVVIAISAILAGTGTITAQTGKQASPKPAEKPTAARPPMPDTNKMTLLIQSTMAAVAHANMTGNYTVLHGLAAAGFQQANSPQTVADLFAAQRSAGLDILPVILFVPKLTAQPTMDDKGMLRLTGYYDTQPQNVLFDLLFVPQAGAWRLFGVSVNTRPAVQAQAAAQPPSQAAPETAKPTAAPAPKKR
jgi:hypothetical protein